MAELLEVTSDKSGVYSCLFAPEEFDLERVRISRGGWFSSDSIEFFTTNGRKFSVRLSMVDDKNFWQIKDDLPKIKIWTQCFVIGCNDDASTSSTIRVVGPSHKIENLKRTVLSGFGYILLD